MVDGLMLNGLRNQNQNNRQMKYSPGKENQFSSDFGGLKSTLYLQGTEDFRGVHSSYATIDQRPPWDSTVPKRNEIIYFEILI